MQKYVKNVEFTCGDVIFMCHFFPHEKIFHSDVKKDDYFYLVFMGRYSLLLPFQPVRRLSVFSHQTLYSLHHLCVCVVQVP